MFLALLLFVGAAGLLFSYLDSGEVHSSSSVPRAPLTKNEKYEQAVNKHLMLTNERIQQQEQRLRLEHANREFGSVSSQRAYQNEDRLDLSQDTRAAEIANELGRGERREEYSSPHDVVQKEIFESQQKEEYSQAYREEFARQFVENARRGGYKVMLSEDLTRVISVTPIRRPSQNQMEVFGSGSGAGAAQ
ncbi:MAG: hypothetical protein HUU57_04040 [Bdellovibrio sp.]|nr:hypothetical protein [Bdellovibrio sp.]